MGNRSLLRLSPWVFAFFIAAACAGQGEGQLCSTLNGNADCASGLTCVARAPAVGDRCCPSDVNLSTTAVCGVHSGTLTADSAAPPLDGGSTDDAEVVDATVADSANAASDDAAKDDAAETGDNGGDTGSGDDGGAGGDAGDDGPSE
jgi:hypothetical protein